MCHGIFLKKNYGIDLVQLALWRVKQTGSIRDYQKVFERLGNRMLGWTQKALIGTFIGGLKPEIVNKIIMFKPKL